MSIEDDMLNTFKYAGFGKKIDPLAMIHTMLEKMEVAMLSQMRERITLRLGVLQGTPQNASMDPFSILEVEMTATKDEVVKAYRQKATIAHPDKGGSNEEMVRVNAAYEAICLFKGWKVK